MTLIRLAFKYLGYGSMETIKSLFPTLAVKELAKFVPDIKRRDVSRGPAGVRAQVTQYSYIKFKYNK